MPSSSQVGHEKEHDGSHYLSPSVCGHCASALPPPNASLEWPLLAQVNPKASPSLRIPAPESEETWEGGLVNWPALSLREWSAVPEEM